MYRVRLESVWIIKKVVHIGEGNLVFRLFSIVIVFVLAPFCVADDHWSNWSDKTLCRLAKDGTNEQYSLAARDRSLTCVSTAEVDTSVVVTQVPVKGIGNTPATDMQSKRFWVDQPDVNDDFQIHFNYIVALDGEDRQWDINGKLEKLLLNLNEEMYAATKANRFSNGEGKRYKFDLRADGKLDITFIRLDKYTSELSSHSPNNDIALHLFRNGMNNPKKIYFNFADFGHEDGGIAGVGVGNIFLRHHKMKRKGFILKNTLHELQHTQGGAYACVPGTRNGHLVNRFDGTEHQLKGGLKLNHLVYKHTVEGCPQLADSVYLTPTSLKTYDPYELNCLFQLGRYTHKKLTAPIEKLRKKGKYDWQVRFGASCQWRNQNRDSDGYFLMGSNMNILKQ